MNRKELTTTFMMISKLTKNLWSPWLVTLSLYFSALDLPPIDGQWCAWSPFSNCSAHCGPGEMVRNRYCISPEPQFGGADCEGDDTEVAECEAVPCPGKYSKLSMCQ